MQHQHKASASQPSNSRGKFIFYGFLAIAAFALYFEHQAHIPGDYLLLGGLLLVCVVMHSFMHAGHGGHGGHGAKRGDPDQGSIPDKLGE